MTGSHSGDERCRLPVRSDDSRPGDATVAVHALGVFVGGRRGWRRNLGMTVDVVMG